MAFEDSSTTSSTGSRYLGEGFRQEPDFREGTTMTTTTVQATAPTSPAAGDSTQALGKRSPSLDYVFDDPADGEPGRDRMLVHGVWELVLVAAVVGFGYV